ncbi:MAG: radical SAM protein [Deltaproteobacteria bacterium]|nr:radical SAM protein [Candidatus Anaeroferrophillus wilburensis]MBN2890143.1 radical SAM protein [Deltaproteobacteria bacterium]
MAADVLLINPWIIDFAAYDLWAKPLGLLYIGDLLRRFDGVQVQLIDCLDAGLLPESCRLKVKRRPNGSGHYYAEEIAKPAALASVPRQYRRFGLPEEVFRAALRQVPVPDAVVVTSQMTYWYPGIQQTIKVLREECPQAAIILGGIYATLCCDHARRHSGADHIVPGTNLGDLVALLSRLGVVQKTLPSGPVDLFQLSPAWDLYRELSCLVLTTSIGCPYRCPYCASARLYPVYRRRPPEAVFAELDCWLSRFPEVKDIAFYDDALLLAAETGLLPLLEQVEWASLAVRFHTPNGLHVKAITRELARAMKRGGFTTIRLSLETTDGALQRQWGGKTEKQQFEAAVGHLLAAGFPAGQLDIYLLVGVPGQCWQQVEEDIVFVRSLGLRPRLTEYSPIPGTALWPAACAVSPYDLQREPLFHNNTLVSCGGREFARERLDELKQLAHGL